MPKLGFPHCYGKWQIKALGTKKIVISKWSGLNKTFVPLQAVSQDVPIFSYHICCLPVHVFIQQTCIEPTSLDMVLALKAPAVW